ncbi:MAG: hypothetical protein JWM21_1375 [Acidobacteria bacterium]|nr:hypothetical protein [Acidobacteriota bacterium]
MQLKPPFLMSLVGTLSKAPKRIRFSLALLAFINVAVPAVLSNYDYSVTQLVLAMILLDICLFPTFRYVLGESGLPILPILCLAFAAQYALPVFFQEQGVILNDGFRYLDEGPVVAALILSILGVVTLQVAYYSLNHRKAVKLLPHVSLPLNRRRAEIFCVAVFLLALLLGRVQALLPDQVLLQFSSIISLLQNQLLVAIGILAWFVFSGIGNRVHKILLYTIVAAAAVKGFTTTMMEAMMTPLAVLFISKWFYTKRFPVSMLIVVGVIFLFLSPVKKNIRTAIVQDTSAAAETSTTDRATDWVNQAVSYWSESFSGRRDLAESTSDASVRTDLIHTFAHIYSLTPSVVPYQYGDTYRYLTITWVPRILWPEKPIANAANNYYAVAYDISTEEGVKTSSFGATLMGEGYMNFGIAGVVILMAFLGLVTSLLEDVFAGAQSGAGGQAIFLATFVYFLNGIGTSAEMLFGALIQNLVASCILLWWVRTPPSSQSVSHLPLIQPASQG